MTSEEQSPETKAGATADPDSPSPDVQPTPAAAAPPEPDAPAPAEPAEPAAPAEPTATAQAEQPAPADEPGGDDASPKPEASQARPREKKPGGREQEGGAAKKKKRRRKKKPGEASSARPATERVPFHAGEEVFGKVTAVLDTAVMIDLGGKALAIFDRTEMEADDLVPSVGDRFVARVHNDGSRGGLVVLTRKPLREEEIKPKLEEAAKTGALVQGLVTGVIKGGVEVDISGLRAFAPASGMDLHPSQANFAALLGQQLDFKVVQYEHQGRDVVVSRRPMLEAEAHERRKHALTLLSEGQVMKGIVRTVVEWGAFVALPEAENLEGLVHASEVSHDARARLVDLLKHGEQIEVKIIKIDEKGKIWLSRKALLEDPWAEAREKYKPGSRHHGKVVRLEEFGAFVSLEDSVDGLLHVADLSFTRVEHADKVLSLGQEVDVIVNNFDNRTKRISLHLAPSADRAEEAPQRIARNANIKVEVIKAEPAGLVVRVLGVTGRGARGFIPAGQTGTQRGTDLRKTFKMGTVIDALVLDVDPRRGEPKLSIRALKEDEERKAHRDYRKQLQAEGGFGTLGDLLAKKLQSRD